MATRKTVTWQEIHTKLDSIVTRLANVRPFVDEIGQYKRFDIYGFIKKCFILMEGSDADNRLAGVVALNKAAKQVHPYPTLLLWYFKEKDEVVRAKIIDLATNIAFEQGQTISPYEMEMNKVFLANRLNDDSWVVVESAILGLGDLKVEELYPTVQSFLFTEENPELRKAAAYDKEHGKERLLLAQEQLLG